MSGATSRTAIWAMATQTCLLLASGCGGKLDQCLGADVCGPCTTCQDGACVPVSGPCGDEVNLTGVWNVVKTTTGNCDGEQYPVVQGYVVDAQQSGASVSFAVTGDTSSPFAATVSGRQISWSESRPAGSGTLTIHFAGTVAPDGASITGSGQWSWTDGAYTCNGTTAVVVSAVSAGCRDVDCGAHGECAVDMANHPVCRCGSGFDLEDLRCVPNACYGITCSGFGDCVLDGGAPSCDCDPNYHPSGLACVADAATCAGVTCSGHGQCLYGTSGPYCDCNGGFHPVGLTCVADVSPCEGVDCGQGSCVVLGPNAVCNCNANFHPVGLTCVADAPPFCVSTANELQAALTAAGDNHQDNTIRLIQGTYLGVFVYYSSGARALVIEGGYTTACAARVVDPANTVLSGGKSGGALSLSSPAAASFSVDGLTLTLGLATLGGGLYASTLGNVTVTHCVVTANWAGEGGGLYIKNAGLVTVSDNTITDNVFNEYHGNGGGMNLSNPTAVVVTRNVITGNNSNHEGTGDYSLGDGGGIFVGAEIGGTTHIDDVTITGNLISDNMAASGGGIAVEHSFFTGVITEVLIANNIITKNKAVGTAGYEGSNGAGLRVTGVSHLALVENTIAQNTADQQGGGLRLILDGNAHSADIHNNIIWGNTAPTAADIDLNNDGDNDGTRSTVSLLCNDFDRTATTGFRVTIPMSIDASNLANVDPEFQNAAVGDYALRSTSLCIDACVKNGVPDVDYGGTVRPQGTRYDMGALESIP